MDSNCLPNFNSNKRSNDLEPDLIQNLNKLKEAYSQSIQANYVLKKSLQDISYVYESFKQRNHLLEQVATQKDQLLTNQANLIKELKTTNQMLNHRITELQNELTSRKDELIVVDDSQPCPLNCEDTESLKLELEREKKSNSEKDLIIANLVKSKSAIKIHFEKKIKVMYNQFMEDIKNASAQSKSEMEKVCLENQKLKALIENASKNKDSILTYNNSLLGHGVDVNKSGHKAVTIINDLTISAKSKKMKLEKKQKVSQVLRSLNNNRLSDPF